MTYKIKSIYETPGEDDGLRILVDRSWPGYVSKDEANLDLWIIDVSPSIGLVKWLENSGKWDEFQERYINELKEKKELIKQLKILEKFNGTVTLVHSTNVKKNSASVLLKLLEKSPDVIKINISRIHG
ncbi:MAG: DUF488 family protein [Methanobacterium sp.]